MNEVLERDNEKYLIRRVKALGGEIRKVRWIGRRNAPDRYVMLNRKTGWLELKRPGKKPTAAQERERQRLTDHGEFAGWANSYEMIDAFLDAMMAGGL